MQAKPSSMRLLLPCGPYLPRCDKLWTGMPWFLLSKERCSFLHDHEADLKVGFNSETVKWSLTLQKVAITRYCKYHGFNELL